MLEFPAPYGNAGGSSATSGGGIGGKCGDACAIDCYYSSYSSYLGPGTVFETVANGSLPPVQVSSPVAGWGNNGANGQNGATYNGTGQPVEYLKYFVPGKGSDGQDGSGGSGGGGGGAGGIRTLEIPSPPPGAGIYGQPLQAVQQTLNVVGYIANLVGEGETVCGGQIINNSTEGGHGGGGGEGGIGGSGGGGGGGVYGIYAYLCTNVAAGNIVYELGDPGEGGEGGPGGYGGSGAPGVDGPELSALASISNRGGRGGRGGDGGDGGHGQNGANGKKYNIWGVSNSALVLGVDTNRICTNSIIGFIKNKDSEINAFVNGSGIAPVSASDTYEEYAVGAPSTIHIIHQSTINNNLYAFHDIAVTQQRPLPSFNIPSHLCSADTLFLMPNDTTDDGYLWRIYLNDSLVKETRARSLAYIPPVKSDTVYYRVELKTYRSCCGWSISVNRNFVIEQPRNLTFSREVIIGRFCEGDSTRLRLNGAPGITIGNFPNLQTIYPGVVWSTGADSVNAIWLKQNGNYSATYTSPNGCVSHTPNYNMTDVLPVPSSPIVSYPLQEVCNNQELTIQVSSADSWWFNYYISPTTQYTLPNGYRVTQFNYTPFFGYGQLAQDSVVIYAAAVSYSGCQSPQRHKVVIYRDKIPPGVQQPFTGYYTDYVPANSCGKVVNYQVPTGVDYCNSYVNVTRISGLPSGSVFPVGVSNVIHRLEDELGNRTEVTTRIEIKDTSRPVIIVGVPDLVVTTQPGTCNAYFDVPAPTAYDNCQGVLPVTTQYSGIWSNDTFGLGTTRFYHKATDSTGNIGFKLHTVTVVDNQPPVVNCPPNMTYYVQDDDTSAYVFYNRPTVTENCITSNIPTLTSGFGQWGWHPLGATTETWSVTDASGNTGSCSFVVWVRDSIRPVLTCPAPVWFLADTGLSYTTISYGMPTATDNLGGTVTLALLSGKASGDTAGIGTHTAVWKGTDSWGNVGTCEVSITVSDREGPNLVCPNNISRNIDQGSCAAVVNFTVAPALDNDLNYYNPVFFYGLPSGSQFPVGTTTVVYKATDAQDNNSYCSFNVTVYDNVAPVFTTPCPGDTTLNITASCVGFMNLPVLTGTDNSCQPPLIDRITGSPSGHFELGMTEQSYRIKDAYGNSNTCRFFVTVVDNNTLSITCPPDITRNNDPGSCTAYIPYYGAPTITPFYVGSCLTWGIQNDPGPNFPVGTLQLRYVADVNNQHAECVFNVTVNDVESPTISKPANIVADINNGDCGKVINFTEPVGTDNCTNGLGTFRISGQAPGTMFPMGTTIQTYVVTDLIGHMDTATFTVTVRDTVKPVLVAPANVTTSTSSMCGTVVNFTEPVGTDNGSCATTVRITGYAPGETFPIGTTTQTYVVTDGGGNADTCVFTVTVNPVYPLQTTCIDNWAQPDPVGYGRVVYYPVPGVPDQISGQPNPCPGVTVILESGRGSGAFFPPGPNYEQYAFVVRNTGDTVRCTTNVIVTEFNPPQIDCGSAQVYEIHPDSGVCTATFTLPVPVVSDGPNGGYITLLHDIDGTPDTNSVYSFTPGFHAVNYRAVDYSGNSANCSVYVNVKDDVQIGNPLSVPVTFCENENVTINPLVTGTATGLTYEWITMDTLGNYITVSTDSVLHFDEIHPSDQHQYTFRVTDRCGATTIGGEFLLQVTPAAATTLSGLANSYCVYQNINVPVSFSPAGGVLDGHGISGTVFNPSLAGVGEHVITYSLIDTNSGCTGIARKTVTVFAKPGIDTFALPVYCINAGTIQLPAANSSYTGNGISGTSFNPVAAGAGNHTVTRTVSIDGCTSTLTQNIRVNAAIPNATITTPATICESNGIYTFTAATTGGAWYNVRTTIDSVTGNARYNSSLAGAGTDTVIYTITVDACTASDTNYINVLTKEYNLPYTFPEFCNTDAPVQFDTVDKWYMGAGFTFDGLFSPANVGFRGPVFYAVVTTNNVGCVDTNYRMLHLRGGQLNTYSYRYVCERGDTVLVNLRNEYDSIRWWNGTTDNPKLFTDTGTFQVFLRDTMGCYGTDTLRIYQHQRPAQIINSTSVFTCPQDSALLIADSAFISYLWSTGDTTQSVSVLPGTYDVTVESEFGCYYQSPPVTVSNGADVTMPVISCAADTVLYATVNNCNVSGVVLTAAAAYDNCNLASLTSNAPVSYAIGITGVTWTAADAAGNTSTCQQQVTVLDTIHPVFTTQPASMLIIDTTTVNCLARVPDVRSLFVAADNCSQVSVVQQPAGGGFVASGTTPITITATDGAGNVTSSTLLYITTDTVKPVLNCPAGLTATAVGSATTAIVTYTAPAGASNCTNTTVQRIAGLGSGAAFPIGVTTETYVVTDGVGAADTCSFTVTVTQVNGISETDGDMQLTVMPVPATDNLTVMYSNSPAPVLTLKITNLTGQLLIHDEVILFKGSYQQVFDVSHIPAGTYLLEITTNNQKNTRKLIKL
jgi:hypothetical protein